LSGFVSPGWRAAKPPAGGGGRGHGRGLWSPFSADGEGAFAPGTRVMKKSRKEYFRDKVIR